MRDRIHEDLLQYRPTASRFLPVFLAVVFLLMPAIRILKIADDPLAALHNFPHVFLQNQFHGGWVFTLMYLFTGPLMIYLWPRMIGVPAAIRLLSAATTTLEMGSMVQGEVAVWAGTLRKVYGSSAVCADARQGIPWRLTMVCMPPAFAKTLIKTPFTPTTMTGEIYMQDDLKAPVVIKSQHGISILARDNEQLLSRWQGLSTPPRSLSNFVWLGLWLHVWAMTAILILFTAVFLVPIRDIMGPNWQLTWTKHSISLYVLIVLVLPMISVFLWVLQSGYRQSVLSTHLLRYGILGTAMLVNIRLIRKASWARVAQYEGELRLSEGQDDAVHSVRVTDQAAQFAVGCLCPVIFDPENASSLMPLHTTEGQLEHVQLRQGRITMPPAQIFALLFVAIFLLLLSCMACLAWWGLFTHRM